MKKNMCCGAFKHCLFPSACVAMMFATLTLSCTPKTVIRNDAPSVAEVQMSPEQKKMEADMQKLTSILTGDLPFGNAKGEAAMLAQNILANKEAFLVDLQKVLDADKAMALTMDGTYDVASFLLKADKQTSLIDGYIPPNIVKLTQESANAGDYMINRNDLSLRGSVEASLVEMAKAARADGITLLVSSTYRSQEYQRGLFDRYVSQSGEEEASRFSARPGRSQHQLGTVVDFGSITDAFAETAAGKWMYDNGGRFGWSLSFPQDYEEVTGYIWESWHWRYIGEEAVKFQQKWFKNIQQYMIEFVHAWGDV